jgi:hypothetical protein
MHVELSISQTAAAFNPIALTVPGITAQAHPPDSSRRR